MLMRDFSVLSVNKEIESKYPRRKIGIGINVLREISGKGRMQSTAGLPICNLKLEGRRK